MELKTKQEKQSYAIALNMGMNMRQMPIAISVEAALSGFADALKNSQPVLPVEEYQELMQEFQQTMQREREQAMKAAAAGNKQASVKFMEENRTRPGVCETPSGLQYEILSEGSGETPTENNVVSVHYTGKLIDGRVFDTTLKRNQPAEFPVGGVIPGWSEALQLMPVGSKFRIFLPPELAYGENGQPPIIPPNSALSFDVELLNIIE